MYTLNHSSVLSMEALVKRVSWTYKEECYVAPRVRGFLMQ